MSFSSSIAPATIHALQSTLNKSLSAEMSGEDQVISKEKKYHERLSPYSKNN